jgi:cellulose synthase/poly-beta-1,6-N-acetylglucosamine synthase-like glycosyltransferase
VRVLFDASYLLLQAGLLVVAMTTLAWMLYAWRHDTSLEETKSRLGSGAHRDPGPGLSFSLIVPARHEETVLPGTLDGLAGLNHDRFEVLVVVGHDDPATTAVAHAAARAHPGRIRVVIDEHASKTKPRALNTALPYCGGDVVAVFDAEDVVHPELLQMVERRMQLDSCAALQAGVQLMNFWSSWYAVRNVMEYYFWFRSRLHFHSDRGFIPLGGNTVFVRRDLLQLLGGWDDDCLAEDCDLGVRLSSLGLRISVVYETALVTREEAPTSLGVFIRQRTRWNQGFLQVLCKRDWQNLPTRRQRALAVYTLATPFLQAAMGVLMPLSVATAVLTSMPP